MNFLGMFGPGENPSATLVQDGQVTALVEEERLNRIKMAPNNLPIQSALKCLEIAGITLDDVEAIAWGWDCPRYVKQGRKHFDKQNKEIGYHDEYNSLQQDLNISLYHPVIIERALQLGLGGASKKNKIPPVKYFPHHLCHAASSFYSSGFEESNILTIDGSGEETTALLCVGNKNGIKILDKVELPHSLGGFYATFTEYLGFRAYMDEGKVMGLASYGKYSEELQNKLDQVITYDEGGKFRVNQRMRYAGEHTFGARFTDELVELFGPKRNYSESAMTSPYPDIAFNIQFRLEQIVVRMAKRLHGETGLKNFCMAGGVAMNCKMNGVIAQQDFVEDIFVQPAAADNGVSMGAAQLLAKSKGENVHHRMHHAYLGHGFTNEEIEKALKESKLPYRRSDAIEKEVAALINAGSIIGWFQGRMETAARALGNRSILASPVFPEMKDKLNLEVKHRENWRPFCPSMKAENYKKYINATVDSPFMILAFDVNEDVKEAIPSCVHVDGTARPQAVKKEHNERFWTLIDEFEKLSGYGILINTSFNIQGEPIVCSPRDAIRTFGGTGIDVLAIGDFIVDKRVW